MDKTPKPAMIIYVVTLLVLGVAAGATYAIYRTPGRSIGEVSR